LFPPSFTPPGTCWPNRPNEPAEVPPLSGSPPCAHRSFTPPLGFTSRSPPSPALLSEESQWSLSLGVGCSTLSTTWRCKKVTASATFRWSTPSPAALPRCLPQRGPSPCLANDLPSPRCLERCSSPSASFS